MLQSPGSSASKEKKKKVTSFEHKSKVPASKLTRSSIDEPAN